MLKQKRADKGTEGDNLPLCYASFELIRNMIKASKRKQREGKIVQSINLYEREDNKKKQRDNPSRAIDTSGDCDEVPSHGE